MKLRFWLTAGFGVLVGCFSDAPAVGGSDGGNDCPVGGHGCACYGNGTCDAGLRCETTLQLCISESCTPGAMDCPCDNGGCTGELVCDGSLCSPPGATVTSGNGDGDVGPGGPEGPDEAPFTSGPDATSADATGMDATGGTDGACVPVGEFQSLTFFSPSATWNPVAQGGEDPRTHVDKLCAAEVPMGCSDPHAVFSVSETDTVAALGINFCLPLDVPVQGPSGAVIATSFQDAVDGSLSNTLNGAEVFAAHPSEVTAYWTGAEPTGGYSADDCDGWGVGLRPVDGAVGSPDDADTPWLSAGVSSCTTTLPIVCVCAVSGA